MAKLIKTDHTKDVKLLKLPYNTSGSKMITPTIKNGLVLNTHLKS